MKRKIAVLTVLLLLMLAGCDQDVCAIETTAPVQTTATETTAPQSTGYQFPKGAVLDVYAGHASSLRDTLLNDFIEDATGLDIQWMTNPYDCGGCILPLMKEKIFPSLTFGTSRTSYNVLGRSGIVVNLWEYQEIMPNFFAHFNSPQYADYKAAYMLSEDELYSAPVFLNGDVQCCGWIYREDIFQALELEVPTDWDSFYACLQTLKAAYPDSYPFTMRNMTGNLGGLKELAQQFGVDYSGTEPVLDAAAGSYYDSGTTDAMRELLKKLDLLMDEGLMDARCLTYDTSMWQKKLASGDSFITHDKAYLLGQIESDGKKKDPAFSLNWFNNIPMVPSQLPYQPRTLGVMDYCWIVTAKCADVELALRYLDWMYSEEGAEILSWGVKGKSFGVDADGEKYFLDGYDRTFQARYQDSGWVDFDATLSAYDEKTKGMILGTMAAAAEGGFQSARKLIFSQEEQDVINNYKQQWVDTRCGWLTDFLAGRKDIRSDAQWREYKNAIANQHIEEIIAAYDSAYARDLKK